MCRGWDIRNTPTHGTETGISANLMGHWAHIWRPVLVKIVIIKLPHKSAFSVTVVLLINLLCIFIGGANFF